MDKANLIQDCLNAKAQAMQESVARGNASDDIKSASGKIYTELKRILNINQGGNNKCAFIRDTITPLVTEDTHVYKKLEAEIFG
ncbi:hypothetical protein [Hymenobacter radiodurans]|uniref:hypothetical protein n=1 Tax=Hymenobacter radiodurans TaxID=2496028 RepID=UPI00196A274E|nr:hypothetical protein [Hymenobacter radiodurans]